MINITINGPLTHFGKWKEEGGVGFQNVMTSFNAFQYL